MMKYVYATLAIMIAAAVAMLLTDIFATKAKLVEVEAEKATMIASKVKALELQEIISVHNDTEYRRIMGELDETNNVNDSFLLDDNDTGLIIFE